MATLLLQVAGQAAGAALGPVGALAGRAAGALAGRAIDQALFSRDAPARHVEGPRLKELDVQSSSEGSPIPRIYGRARLAGQLIWATRFEEDVVTRTERSSGGKYGGGSATTTTSYRYYANFALGLCEGPVTRIGRVWADGKLLDTSTLAMRIYNGAADQLPDPLIEARHGERVHTVVHQIARQLYRRREIPAFFRFGVEPDCLWKGVKQALDPHCAGLVVPVFHAAPRINDFIGAHRRIANKYQLVVGTILVRDFICRHAFVVAPPVVLPQPLINEVVEIEVFQVFELGSRSRKHFLADPYMIVH